MWRKVSDMGTIGSRDGDLRLQLLVSTPIPIPAVSFEARVGGYGAWRAVA